MNDTTSNPACPNCAKLEKGLAELERKLAELEARLKLNSSNSSLPPSSDPPWTKPHKPKDRSGRKPGGQPGHTGHHRERLPAQRVNRVVNHLPKACQHCRAVLPEKAQPHDPPPSWHQVAELPSLVAEVTEHQAHARTCLDCGKITRAEIPKPIQAHTVGPNLAATLSYLSGRCHCSKRTVQEIVETVFDLPISLGSVAHFEEEMSQALKEPHAEALAAVRMAPVKNVDETGWAQGGKLCWLWMAATGRAVAFQIHAKRGTEGFKALLGKIVGIVCSDRWGAYAQLPLQSRQICWAHLKRDFQKLLDLGDATRAIGRAGQRAVKNVFAVWKDFKDGGIDPALLPARLQPVRGRFHKALRRGSTGADKKTKRFCRRLLKVYDALWTFAGTEGVEPTNNHAERMVRPAVLWRKGSFGNHSVEGCRFSERVLTVIQTLRLQQRPVLDYLRRAMVARRAGAPAPALCAN